MNGSMSWGRNIRSAPSQTLDLNWIDDFSWDDVKGQCLPFGQGRSYGDVCLNNKGSILNTQDLNRFISWDPSQARLVCESGVTLKQVLEFAIPRGFFLPVTPGTKYISIGGAVANDVHGKNHHQGGSFGHYIKRFGLLRSDGSHLVCSPEQNSELFRASIGGLGLTGLITWVDFELKQASAEMLVENIPFKGLSEFFAISDDSEDFEYTVAWLDCINAWSAWGRGLFMRGKHASTDTRHYKVPSTKILVPIETPSFLLNRYSCKIFNDLYFTAGKMKRSLKPTHFDPFFYPLDAVSGWNKLYGRHGFFQFQCVLPVDRREVLEQMLHLIADSGLASPLVVLKKFGSVSSVGMMSFPRHGYTLSLDIGYKEEHSISVLRKLSGFVVECGGSIYPAKDSVMSSDEFRRFFPNWSNFSDHVDPLFSSSFWRRVKG